MRKFVYSVIALVSLSFIFSLGASAQEVKSITPAEFSKLVYDLSSESQELEFLGDKPVLLDFYATWCGPCKKLSPILDELAKEYAGKIVIYKIDTDKYPELSGAFGVRSLPTLVYIPMDGEPRYTIGLMPKESVASAIDEILLGK